MKLYITAGSPYARLARMIVIEKGLQSRVAEVVAKTRAPDSPFYPINPSGRVPYLVCEDGFGLEESAAICEYLDSLDGAPILSRPFALQALAAVRFDARALSFLDGLAVWFRELVRQSGERSATVIAHEHARALRLLDWWEEQIEAPWMTGPLNIAQLRLGCALGFALRIRDFDWRPGRPRLARWFESFAERPSYKATEPPAA
jgi:glutathione S-transferase